MASDAKLISQWKKGDKEAFSSFYMRHSRKIYFYLLSLVDDGETAEELLQDTFLRFLGRVDRLNGYKDFGPYLAQIARNQATDRLRRLRREKRALDHAGRTQIFAGNGASRIRELSPGEAGELLGKLPRAQREAVILKIYLGFSFAEISLVMEAPLNTAVSRYRYGLEKLKALLQGEES